MRKILTLTTILLLVSKLTFAQGMPVISTVGPAQSRDLTAQMLSVTEGYILVYLDSSRLNTQLYFTSDVALTWSPRAMRGLPESGTGIHLGVHFYSTQEGIYLTQNRIFRTINGGDDWVQVYQPSGSYAMCHYGDTTYVVGSSGNFYRSYDAGQNWASRNWNDGNPVIIGCACDQYEVSMWALPNITANAQAAVRMFHNEVLPYNYLIAYNWALMDNRGFAKHYQAFSAMEVYKFKLGSLSFTSDGGVTYYVPRQETPGPVGTINNYHWIDKNHGFKVVENRVYATIDAAEGWYLSWQHFNLENRPLHVFSSPMGNYVHIAVLREPDSNGISLLDVITNTAFNGLSTRPNEKPVELSVYPNPATTALRISGANAGEVYELMVTDVGGKRMISLENWETSSELDVSGLPVGMYFYQLKSKTGYHNGRFIKQ